MKWIMVRGSKRLENCQFQLIIYQWWRKKTLLVLFQWIREREKKTIYWSFTQNWDCYQFEAFDSAANYIVIISSIFFGNWKLNKRWLTLRSHGTRIQCTLYWELEEIKIRFNFMVAQSIYCTRRTQCGVNIWWNTVLFWYI